MSGREDSDGGQTRCNGSLAASGEPTVLAAAKQRTVSAVGGQWMKVSGVRSMGNRDVPKSTPRKAAISREPRPVKRGARARVGGSLIAGGFRHRWRIMLGSAKLNATRQCRVPDTARIRELRGGSGIPQNRDGVGWLKRGAPACPADRACAGALGAPNATVLAFKGSAHCGAPRHIRDMAMKRRRCGPTPKHHAARRSTRAPSRVHAPVGLCTLSIFSV